MRVLVTGSNGQLGQSLQAITTNAKHSFEYKNSRELDIADELKVAKTFEKNNFDYCINCAAYTAVDKAESEPNKAFAVNVTGVENLAKVCLKHDVILIHISTDFVFDGMKTTPYTEEDTPNPINTYGKTKLQGEQVVQELLAKYFIIRTSWLYSEYGSNFVKTMVRLGKERDELQVVNDQFGTPTYAGYLAKVILHIINSSSKEYGLYHYSNEGECSWFDFAEEIFRISSIDITLKGISTAEYPTAAERPVYSVLCKDKIYKNLAIQRSSYANSLTKLFDTMFK